MSRSRFSFFLTLVACALIATSCSEATTAPTKLSATLRVVQLSTDSERLAWPLTPAVRGGTAIVVRGTAIVPCGRAVVQATRLGDEIDVAVVPDAAEEVCPAVVSPAVPFEVTVAGLATGRYDVHATAAGLTGEADWQVSVGP